MVNAVEWFPKYSSESVKVLPTPFGTEEPPHSPVQSQSLEDYWSGPQSHIRGGFVHCQFAIFPLQAPG